MIDTSKTYWVLTNENEIQNMIQYKDGFVKVESDVYEKDLCTGIVFASEDIFSCVNDNTRYIRQISIPNNANTIELKVENVDGKPITLYKTDRAIFESRRDFDFVTINELIDDYGVNIDCSNSKLLSYFCNMENMTMCRYLIKKGIRLDYPYLRQQPLVHAIKSKNIAIFKLIFKSMKDYRSQSSYMRDLMMYIVCHGTIEMLRYVMWYGARVVAKTKSSISYSEFQGRLIKQACLLGRLDMLRYLIDSLHVKINLYYNDSLEYAVLCEYENIEMIRYLLSKGVNVHSNDDRAFRYAVERNRIATVYELVNAGANIHVYGDIALLVAYKNGFDDLLEYLVDLDEYNRESIHCIDRYTDIAHTL